MKRFRCGDVVPGCPEEFVGEEAQILREVADHARRDHGIETLGEDVREAVRARMTQT